MRIKNVIIYFLTIIIILLSLKMPDILMKNLSNNLEKKLYKIVENKNQIDVKAEKIYLVKAIHSIKSDNSLVTISSSDGKKIKFESYKINSQTPDIDKEIELLQEYKILNDFNFNDSNNCIVEMGIIDKSYLSNNEYIVHNVLANIDDDEIHLEIENKTGKVIYAYFDKNNFYNGDIEETLRNYIKYLDFHIIKDWKYEEDLMNKKYSLKSESAKLTIVLDESNDKYELSIHVSNF